MVDWGSYCECNQPFPIFPVHNHPRLQALFVFAHAGLELGAYDILSPTAYLTRSPAFVTLWYVCATAARELLLSIK